MEKDPNLSSVNQMILKAIVDPDAEALMSEAEKNKTLHEAERLHFHWLIKALKQTKKFSLKCMVRASQRITVYLLNELFDRYSKRRSIFKKHLEKSLVSFLNYLKTDQAAYFDFNSQMPKGQWKELKQRILEILMPEEKQGMEHMDATLVDLVHKQYHLRIGRHTATFAQAFYWQTLTGRFNETIAVNDATLQTIYTLIAYNFNCYAFVQYVISYYGKELSPDKDAIDFWKEHLLLLNRIELPDISKLALDPQLPHCRKLLFKAIKGEMQAFVYTNETNKLIAAPISFKTSMNSPMLGLYYRLLVNTGMLEEGNVIELMKKVALLYQTPGGSLSYTYLRDKFYTPERHAILEMKTCLSKMMNRLNELEKEMR